MRWLLLATLLLPVTAMAQTQQPDLQAQALGAALMDEVSKNVQLRARIIALEAELAKLKADAPKPEK